MIFSVLFKKFRSFIAKNLKSVGQRAAKLLAVKVGGLKKKSATLSRPRLEFARGWIILKVWWLVTLQPFDLQTSIFFSFKDLNLLKRYTKNQEASSILKVVFAFSKWPYLVYRAYVISGCIFFATAVCSCMEKNVYDCIMYIGNTSYWECS